MEDEERQQLKDEIISQTQHPEVVYLQRISRDMGEVKQMLRKVISYMVEAEKEVSEKMRRFMMYMHDLHDICYMYTEMGHEPPPWIKRELERCDDRLRQLLDVEHAEGGTFAKVRGEMAADPLNRWDHTRQLAKPKENGA